MTIENKHAEAAYAALTRLKELACTLDDWEFSQEKNGVRLYSKADESSPIPIVRGDVVLQGHEFTAQQVAAVATLPGCRRVWDEKYDGSEVKEIYKARDGILEALFWSKIKTPWPISPRDISATSLRDTSNENECYVVMTSVEDEQIPPVSGSVRANLMISGWKIIKTETGIAISYITQVDLAGSIPTTFLKGVQQQVPLCAGAVVNYIQENGFPPITSGCTGIFKSENFNHEERKQIVNLDGTGECKWLISNKMYPNGVKISVVGSGGNAIESIVDGENGNKIAIVSGINGPTTITIDQA
ncbi:hypothetical protein BDF20DRAFT_894958 [Mycotypha africana]|uniref:uncharacterized protein n=1 Tax=Mycotypha africana TaxID=64632 RepID=UPI002300E90B|nr:uncharacterized protein BDF20DRAFT_894958 [Mycotypha africana]KAI8968201.1 hypothetical protein BDF20DRAFT_894958 [Mycotypha africana]